MRARFVINRVLDELKARQAGVIEIQVIGAADALNRQRCRAEVVKRLQPAFRDRISASSHHWSPESGYMKGLSPHELLCQRRNVFSLADVLP
jgi:hypothetical protein